jgi:peroxiredoxin
VFYSAVVYLKGHLRTFIYVSLMGALLLTTLPSRAAESASVSSSLQALVQKIQTKVNQGQKTEKEMEAELKEFDALLAKHKGEKTDEVAQIAWMKAMLYLQVFEDSAKALPLLKQIKSDFPETKFGQSVDNVLASLERQEAAKKIQASLVVGAKFPDFQEKDIDGKSISVSQYKGKVVLVDFWATWCGPCISELPNVLAAYEKYHPRGFEILGLSLDQDEQKLRSFIKDRKMPWQQYFDGKVWENKLAQKYGVVGIPATYLLDGNGVIIGRDLRGDELDKAVALAVAKK